MTAPRRGRAGRPSLLDPAPRGRPPIFDTALRAQYLDLVTAGMPLGEAALTVGISLRLPTSTAQREPAFAQLLLTAKQKGRQVRAESKEHGVTRYKHYDCRCPTCTKAVAVQRANAPSRTTHPDHPSPQETPPAEVIHMPEPKSSTSFLLLVRAS
ncbi:hypothetical protein [Streptomyces sp. NPDC058657]|uniref:hypothetical protein n=1 Tax=unclassified Streptomyces TaxID=2593676 RepID=UPI00364AB5D1